jgi:hypothetical protein
MQKNSLHFLGKSFKKKWKNKPRKSEKNTSIRHGNCYCFGETTANDKNSTTAAAENTEKKMKGNRE